MIRRLVILSILVVSVCPIAQGNDGEWVRLTYDPVRESIYDAIVDRNGTIITFGGRSTIRLFDVTSDTLLTMSGKRFVPDLVCGGLWFTDSLLAFTEAGELLVTGDTGRTWQSVGVPIMEGPRDLWFVERHGAIAATHSGLYLVTADRNTTRISESKAITTHKTGQHMLVGFANGDLLASKSGIDSWERVHSFIDSVVAISSNADSVWVIAGSSVLVSGATDLRSWRTVSTSLRGGRSVCMLSDTIVATTYYGGESYVFVSGDWGTTWLGGAVSSKGFPKCMLLQTDSSIFAYGSPGFYRIARIGSLYNAQRFAVSGFGSGPERIYLHQYVSIDRWDDLEYLVVVATPQMVLKSLDSATTWRIALGDSNKPTYRYHFVRCHGDSEATVVGEHSVTTLEGQSYVTRKYMDLFRTRDRGLTWSHLPYNEPNRTATRCLYLDSGRLLLYGGRDVSVVGTDFSTIDTLPVRDPGLVTSIATNSNGIIVAAGTTLSISLDQGRTWQDFDYPDADDGIRQVAVLNDNKVILVTSTYTAGVTENWSRPFDIATRNWSARQLVGSAVPGNVLAKAIETDGIKVIAIAAQLNRVYTSNNAGAEWVEHRLAEEYQSNFHDVSVDAPGTITVCGDGDLALQAQFATTAVHVDHLGEAAAVAVDVRCTDGMLAIKSEQDLTGSSVSVYTIDGRRVGLSEISRGERELTFKVNSSTGTELLVVITIGQNTIAKLLLDM